MTDVFFHFEIQNSLFNIQYSLLLACPVATLSLVPLGQCLAEISLVQERSRYQQYTEGQERRDAITGFDPRHIDKENLAQGNGEKRQELGIRDSHPYFIFPYFPRELGELGTATHILFSPK